MIHATPMMLCLRYTLAGTTSINFVANTVCSWSSQPGHGKGGAAGGKGGLCHLLGGTWGGILAFSGLQLFLNVLPNLDSIWWAGHEGNT